MLLCFVVKKQLFDTRTPPPRATTDSLRNLSANNNLLKHPSPQSRQSSKWQLAISFLCKELVHCRSIPRRRLWQSTKTGRRWGRWADVVFTDTRHSLRVMFIWRTLTLKIHIQCCPAVFLTVLGGLWWSAFFRHTRHRQEYNCHRETSYPFWNNTRSWQTHTLPIHSIPRFSHTSTALIYTYLFI